MSQYNKEGLELPTWLDQSFFEEVLRTYRPDSFVTVNSFQIRPNDSHHFASTMFKITVNYVGINGEATAKLIMKIQPEMGEYRNEEIEKSYGGAAFTNEIRMYEKVLSEMEKILMKAGIETKFAPTLVYASVDKYPSPVIVFEDVSVLGFSSPNWGVLSLDKGKVVISTIAKFHALSIYLNETVMNLTDFNKHFFKTEIDASFGPYKTSFKPSILSLVDRMKTWRGYEELTAKIENKVDDLIKEMHQYYMSNTFSVYRVLNHADLHFKNFMFRNRGTTPDDFLLVDYQFPIWFTPAHDIYWLLNAIADSDLQDNFTRDDLVDLYYTEFSVVLGKIGYKGKIPTMFDLKNELKQHWIIDFLQMVGFAGMQFVDMSKFDFNEFKIDRERALANYRKTIYSSEQYSNFLKKHLRRLEAQGSL